MWQEGGAAALKIARLLFWRLARAEELETSVSLLLVDHARGRKYTEDWLLQTLLRELRPSLSQGYWKRLHQEVLREYLTTQNRVKVVTYSVIFSILHFTIFFTPLQVSQAPVKGT